MSPDAWTALWLIGEAVFIGWILSRPAKGGASIDEG